MRMQPLELLYKKATLNSFAKFTGKQLCQSLFFNLFEKQKETLPTVFTSSQIFYLANFDGAADRVTSQSSKWTDFYWDHEEADIKMFAYFKFLCDNIRLSRAIIVLLDTDARVISLYQSVTKPYNLRCNMVQNWYRWPSEIHSYTRINFRIRITN